MSATAIGRLPLPASLQSSATNTHVFGDLHSASLISLGQLCDDDCVAILDKHKIQVIKDSQVVMQGHRNPDDGLWDIPIERPIRHKALAIITRDKTKTELIQYLHGCCFSPTPRTFLRAIKNGNFLSWPGLNIPNITRFLPPSIATALGHLDQERANLQSTKSKVSPLQFLPSINTDVLSEDEDFAPAPSSTKTFDVCGTIIPFVATRTGYHDLTGAFPHKSSRGNQYIFVLYDYDGNAILTQPIKNRQAATIRDAWLSLHQVLQRSGNAPNLYIMDNEASSDIKDAMFKHKISFQLAPPHMHRRNAAERAIRTFKNHFVAGFSTTDPNFPVSEWDRLLDQATITLNLLRQSRVNPKLSAYAYLFGNYDFNRCPMAPPGTRVVVHDKPDQRTSWGHHGTPAWYIGPSLEHYRTMKCYMPTTGSIRYTDTLQFIPATFKFPETTTEDYLRQSVGDILALLQDPPKTLPFLSYGDATKNAVTKIAQLLQRSVPQPRLPIPPLVPLVTQPASALPRVPPVLPSPVDSPRVQTNVPVPRVQVYAPFQSIQPPNTRVLRSRTKPLAPKPVSALTKRFPSNRPFNPRVLRPRHGGSSGAATTPHLLMQHIFECPQVFDLQRLLHLYNKLGKKETIDTLLAGPRSSTWWNAVANELGRLANGVHGRVRATNTLRFIPRSAIPSDRQITYANFICDYRPLKSEPYRVRLTVGGDRLDCLDDTSSPAASLLETKLLLNSTISDAHLGARFMTMDLKDFFLATPMARPEYMRIHSKYFPPEIRALYQIDSLIASDGYMYMLRSTKACMVSNRQP
jgi:hypothetical protein